ncbi:hypothetical protein Taro_009200 [Colocasia esculenta]|uniref:Uncharacterized protein n=1 Tax=Colocasia esculenta TaxID=4460 RepID=A0A843U4A4_COLES|nr:hypothetical protein [Colocasia esculenta]
MRIDSLYTSTTGRRTNTLCTSITDGEWIYTSSIGASRKLMPSSDSRPSITPSIPGRKYLRDERNDSNSSVVGKNSAVEYTWNNFRSRATIFIPIDHSAYALVMEHFNHPFRLELCSMEQSLAPTTCSCYRQMPSEWTYSCQACKLLPPRRLRPDVRAHPPSCPSRPPPDFLPVSAYSDGCYDCDAYGGNDTDFSYHCGNYGLDFHPLCISVPASVKHQGHPHTHTLSYPSCRSTPWASPATCAAAKGPSAERERERGRYAGHQQWVGVQVCDVYCVLAAMVLPLTCSWRPLMWTSSVHELGGECCGRLVGELLLEFWWSTGVRGAAVVRVVAANQAGNDELESGVRGAFLEFQRDSRFFESSIAFLRTKLPI